VHRKQTALIGVKLHRPAPALQVAPQHAQVLFRAVVPRETRVGLARGVIDHRHQVQPRPPPFQPVVLRGVPLHQLPATAPSRSPHVHLLHLPPLHPPQPRPDQPLPQRLLAHRHLVVLGQVLAGQRGPEGAVLCLQQLQRFGPHASPHAPVPHPPPPPIHHGPVALHRHTSHHTSTPTI